MEDNLKTRIEMYIEHLKQMGVMEESSIGLRIYADRLLFGTATKEGENLSEDEKGKKGVMFVLQSDIAKMEFVHVVESKELLVQLRNIINNILREEVSVEVV